MQQTRKDVLNGWKEIAAYLGRDPRTVERWEKQRSLPVRRLPGSGRATVYALMPELDEWLASSRLREVEPQVAAAPVATSQAVVPAETGAAAGAATAAVERAERGLTPAPGPNHRVGWRLWTAAGVLVALVCGAGLAGAGWRRRHSGPEPAAIDPAVAVRVRSLVPSSAVFGVEELYLRGCYQEEMRTPDSLKRAKSSFEAAIAKDGQYAPAFAGLASTYILLREYSMLPDGQAYPAAKEAAARALVLDPGWPQAHAAMGFVDFFWDWDAVASEAQFRQAVQADPTSPLAHHWFGSVLTHEGRFREGLAELEVAQRLDPSSAAILTSRAFALGLSGRREVAAEMLQEAISGGGAYRHSATMHQVLGLIYLMPPRDAGRYLGEATLAALLREDEGTAATMRMASAVLRKQGEQAMWRALLDGERKRHPQGGPTYPMARYEAELGEKEQALNDLAELFTRHDTALIGISVDPLFEPLRKESRFLQLRAAMGLPSEGES